MVFNVSVCLNVSTNQTKGILETYVVVWTTI